MRRVRLVEAGEVSHLRSQTIYHGLAHARTEATPDTLVLLTPGEPYVCVGLHQDLGHELDLEYCRARKLPVLRRETGGGAVYLDSDQLFVQWVMGPESLPASLERRFELFALPLIATYRALGIAAQLHPVNDVQVGGRKIVGTGAGRLGRAEVLVGNLIFDFDTEVMARILRAPSEAFRTQVARSLREYMTSMRRELGELPGRAEVARLYREEFARALGVRLEPGELTAEELESIERVDRRLASAAFLEQEGGLRRRGVKIHESVHVVEARLHDGAGTVRATARVRADRIEEIELAAEHHGVERDGTAPLERALRGCELARDSLLAVVRAHRPACHPLGEQAWVELLLDLAPSTPSPRASAAP